MSATATPTALLTEVLVPDLGEIKDAPIIEVLAQVGAEVRVDDTLVTLETEKATMDVPSTAAGTVREVRVKVGDSVAPGSVLVLIEAAAPAGGRTAEPVGPSVALPRHESEAGPGAAVANGSPASRVSAASGRETQIAFGNDNQKNESNGKRDGVGNQAAAPSAGQLVAPEGASTTRGFDAEPEITSDGSSARLPHASPSVRRFARELGVDLSRVPGTGPKARILQEDVQQFVKAALSQPAPAAVPRSGISGPGLDLLPWPQVDFAKFGPVERVELSKIKKISGANLLRNSLLVPHVTNFDEADVTELEAFRVEVNKAAKDAAGKLTMLAFLIKASVAALRQHPLFNASLDGDQLILKRYFHIGFAADTPNGLVVPVIRNADTKGLRALAAEMSELASQARAGKLKPGDMQGGCFTISSLGGIGGTGFTPIINAPEVAILGAARGKMTPVWDGAQFAPRLILPISVSWDHRVIDGAEAARFLQTLSGLLGDFRRVML